MRARSVRQPSRKTIHRNKTLTAAATTIIIIIARVVRVVSKTRRNFYLFRIFVFTTPAIRSRRRFYCCSCRLRNSYTFTRSFCIERGTRTRSIQRARKRRCESTGSRTYFTGFSVLLFVRCARERRKINKVSASQCCYYSPFVKLVSYTRAVYLCTVRKMWCGRPRISR